MTLISVKEYEDIESDDLSDEALKECRKIADYPYDKEGNYRCLLCRHEGNIKTQKYVGILSVADTAIEIFPKIKLSKGGDEAEREVFFQMLCHYIGIDSKATMMESEIGKLKKYGMLEVFKSFLLQNLLNLVKAGIVSQYHEDEDNLPYMKGRIYFPQHIRQNIANKARFYVRYDEYSPNHAANRLIRRVLHKMRCEEPKNHQLRGQLDALFETATPLHKAQGESIQGDLQRWQQHRLNRNMTHYKGVMPLVELFLLFYGLTTFRGKHTANSLLFPMEDVFEDFVGHHFKQYAKEQYGENWEVKLQSPKTPLLESKEGNAMFGMKPDIHIERKRDKKKFILDTKWKHIDEGEKDKEIKQDDLYQLFAYGRVYGANPVVLIYPKNENFSGELKFTYQDKGNPPLRLICCSFDVERPQKSVGGILKICREDKNPTIEKDR